MLLSPSPRLIVLDPRLLSVYSLLDVLICNYNVLTIFTEDEKVQKMTLND